MGFVRGTAFPHVCVLSVWTTVGRIHTSPINPPAKKPMGEDNPGRKQAVNVLTVTFRTGED